MTHSLFTADRNMHLKIVGVAVAASVLVVTWLGAQSTDSPTTLARDNAGPAIKSRPAVSVTSNGVSKIH